ncbi:MAG TPA: nucleoside-diphosphate sugar epimerase/dehydratase [Gemmatimonadaceae bacterium]|nr:nucleoside-diphosphate sugar epimerase/dehydratase [Gemmatimonadaceae bacterium]
MLDRLPRSSAAIFLAHLPIVALGYWAAFALRFDLAVPPEEAARYWITLPILLVLRMGTLWYFGLFRGMWRHAGLPDLVRVAKAVTLGSFLFAMILLLVTQLPGFPRSVLAMEWMIAVLATGGSRFFVRYVREGQAAWTRKQPTRALLIGAGIGAERLLRLLQHEERGDILVVGLVDDDPRKRGWLLHGVPVIGTTEDLPRLAAEHHVGLLVIAIPSATGEQMRRIVERCAASKVEFRVFPSLNELLAGRLQTGELRPVQIDDLLGRAPVHLDMSAVERDLSGQVVLVTGGAGSIGSELARQVARFGPRRLVIVEQAESPLYFIHLELARLYPELDIVPVVGSVADEDRLDSIFATHRPAYVFHAAAYKHVPLMEANITEAVRNNVHGTLCVAECAARYGARRVVLISTDKAVNPSSIMGATKRVAERLTLELSSLQRQGTDFRAVRFGNVLGSDGSVIPLFERQLRAGGPLTVTHPDATRYFMTIPEAVQLVLQAASLPEAAGRVCMLDMGEPVRVLDLAENMVRLSGLAPYRDVPITFTGLRPGEKLREELTSALEATVPSSVPKIRIVQTSEADETAVERGLRRLAAALLLRSQPELVVELCALVPECVPPLRDLADRAAALREVPLHVVPIMNGDRPSRDRGGEHDLPGSPSVTVRWTQQAPSYGASPPLEGPLPPAG